MQLHIERLDDEGLGVSGRYRVPYTLPGEVVEPVRTFRKKRFIYVPEFRLVSPSPDRVPAKCPHYGVCGGCRLQHMSYKDQVRFKEEKLERILGFSVSVTPSPVIFGHRNRIDVVITPDGIGFRQFGSWWRVFDLEDCPVFGPRAGEAVSSLREYMDDHKLQPYNLKTHEGFLRYIVLREGKNTGEFMINLVTTEGGLPDPTPYFSADSIYHSVNNTLSDVSHGEPIRFWGAEYIKERLKEVLYLIHPNSFFQTNTYQAETLVTLVADHVDGETVLDLYSGVGTFSIFLAKRGFTVSGIEINPFSVDLARKNAELNGVSADFTVGKDSDVSDFKEYDTVIVDPPRAGLHPKLAKRLAESGPETLIYVSCNPKTYKRDLETLSNSYRLETVTGVDMFPHTPHVELFSVLRRRS
ncbi:MAG: tRNA (uracil-5-)-methyltransferase [Candidatus Diapherotrites archaeon]|nr:tRNA (uracil-5-)-methyltransferase [Candidatus Diapherotrites archaeon]MDN5366820.1 tRNA (uracil-5-)-methyltransferase [Candidatus Diapherotrites archaeon]